MLLPQTTVKVRDINIGFSVILKDTCGLKELRFEPLTLRLVEKLFYMFHIQPQ